MLVMYIFKDRPTPLAMVVVVLVGLIVACSIAAISLAVMHYQESLMATTTIAIEMKAAVADCPSLPRVASATSLKRGATPVPLGSDMGCRTACKLRHRSNSCCSPMASNPDHIDISSICDTQETMDSAMVQEILGSVDANHVRETQVLLRSYNWDLEELLQEEVTLGKAL
ncbi:hypothetical protein VaNZ11_006439 [Volvox africanus]|uniref:Pherophorin domain-containing protein n=1 Tax=Volvox africanus TaxID=51714 RepID=A0ABQ5S0P6_9CHLO|nr:hypothetical protein VaNZ11_006439 [Volvox africanus]